MAVKTIERPTTLAAALESDEAYTASLAKARDLRTQIADIDGRTRELLRQMHTSSAFSVDEQATRFLTTGELPKTAGAEALRGQLNEIRDQRGIVRRAELQQHEIVERELSRIRSDQATRLQPEYREKLRETALNLLKTLQAQEALEAIRVQYSAAGLGVPPSSMLPAMQLTPLGPLNNDRCYAAIWFQAAVKLGAIEANEVLEAWRTAWRLA